MSAVGGNSSAKNTDGTTNLSEAVPSPADAIQKSFMEQQQKQMQMQQEQQQANPINMLLGGMFGK